MPTSHWWRETGTLYVRYLIVGVASIPAAVVYAYLASNNLDRPWVVLLLLLSGLGLAGLGWRASEQLLARKTRAITPITTQARTTATIPIFPALSVDPRGLGLLPSAIPTSAVAALTPQAHLQSHMRYTTAMPVLASARWSFSIVNTGRQPILDLSISLEQRIRGQNEMVSAVAKSVQQAAAA